MTNIPTSRTYLQVQLGLPISGGPHAIFLPQQKRHARVCLLSEANFLLAGAGLRCKARCLGDITLSLGMSYPGNLTKSNSEDLKSSPVSTPELRSNKSLCQESDIPLNH